jgi:hypothetical protein
MRAPPRALAGLGGGGLGESRRNLWFQEPDGSLTVRTVKTGIANAMYTEVVDFPEIEGLAVIIREK